MSSDFRRNRDRFERKRKSYDHHSYEDDRDSYDRRRSSSDRRRSRSPPPRWERGKKQKQKTMTDVPGDRELFVGKFPPNLDQDFLLSFLNGAMRLARLCPNNESPCVSCQISSSGFAFVELSAAKYANACLNLNGILFLNSRLKVGRPKKYSGPFVVSKTWQELTGEALTVDAVLDSETEKVNRELFVGNTTPEMTDQLLSDFLGSAMESVGLSIMGGNPISTCEMFGKYAFIELRTPREAAHALCLNNIPFMGVNLQITRPSKYQGKFETHPNWEHVLAKFNMKPEEYSVGTIVNPVVLAATPVGGVTAGSSNQDGDDTMESDGPESITAVKAELAQVKRALEITRHQLEESNKKSEARKEQLVALNRKWSDGKADPAGSGSTQDMDVIVEQQELRKKHEETQDMLRGVTESLVKATEKLAKERKIRQDLEKLMNSSTQIDFGASPTPTPRATSQDTSGMSIDFDSLRAEMKMNAEQSAATATSNPVKDEEAMSDQPNNASTPTLTVDTSATPGGEPQIASLKEFLAKTPKTPIDWTAASTATPASGTSRERGGVRLCRLLVHVPDMDAKLLDTVQADAGKYNLGGYIKPGKPGLVIVEGLEFNCDIFMDNLERQKKKFKKVGKVNERSQRAFPKEVTCLDAKSGMDDFAKAADSVGLKSKLEESLSK